MPRDRRAGRPSRPGPPTTADPSTGSPAPSPGSPAGRPQLVPSRDPCAPRRAGVVAALLRLSRLVAGELRTGAGELGLTPAQAEALRFAARIRPDMATPGQLARLLGVRSPTAIGIVAPLIERGLLVRRPHPYDRRRSILALTAAGRALHERLERLTADLEATLADLEPPVLEQIEVGLAALVGVFVRSGRLVVAAPCAGCVHFRPDAAPGTPRPHRCALLRRNLSTDEAAMNCPEHVAAG